MNLSSFEVCSRNVKYEVAESHLSSDILFHLIEAYLNSCLSSANIHNANFEHPILYCTSISCGSRKEWHYLATLTLDSCKICFSSWLWWSQWKCIITSNVFIFWGGPQDSQVFGNDWVICPKWHSGIAPSGNWKWLVWLVLYGSYI